MSIITISRGSYSRGKEVAEKVAAALGYECISRDILLEASEQFNIPEIKLVRAIHDAPSILERFTYGKERYVAYLKAALLKHIQKDNVVYHGLAGHFFLQDIPHVLKVRIVADLDDRVADEMKREGISVTEAQKLLQTQDKILKDTPDVKLILSSRADKDIEQMDMIVTATSGAGKKVLDIMKVKPGAVITDVVRDGKPVCGYAFNSTGRYACGAQMRARFIPRLLKAKPDSLLDGDGLIDRAGAVFRFRLTIPATSLFLNKLAVWMQEAYRRAGIVMEVLAFSL